MKKTPSIIDTYYKSLGTKIFRDTTALPFADGGPLNDKNIHGDLLPSVYASALGRYYSNGGNLTSEGLGDPILTPAQQKYIADKKAEADRIMQAAKNRDINYKQYAAEFKNKYNENFSCPSNNCPPAEYFENTDKLPYYIPEKIEIPKSNLIIPESPEATLPPEYNAPGYHRDYPALTWQHHNSSQLIPHARPHLTTVRVPGLGASQIQKITGYNKQAIEGYEDEEGNWVPGEIEKAQEESRRINFEGSNSFADRRAQKEYNTLYDSYEKEQQQKMMYQNMMPFYIPTKQNAQGGQLKPDYSLPEDSFQQGGRGLKNSVYASSMGQYPAPYAMGGAMNQYPDGGPIYTYAKRPGSYYQKDENGQWLISNKGTGGQYVPVDDPSGQRAAALNKGAVVYNQPVQQGVKPAPLQFTGNINQPVEPAYNPLYTNPNAQYSETTQQVASKLVPQTKQGRQDLEFVEKNNIKRKEDIETFLTTQGHTPEEAKQIVASYGSYGSSWTDLENKYGSDIQNMKNRAAAIQMGENPDSMQEFVPREAQSLGGKVEDIMFNPFTAAGYALRGQAIPDYMGEKIDNGTLGYYANGQFVQGKNMLDNVTDIATPIGWAHSGKNIAERATNNVSGDFWTEENAWDALNVLPGLGFAKAAKAAKGLEAANSTTSLARLGNNVLDLAERAQLTRTKPQIIESAIDAGSIAREPFYAPQRPSLLNPGTSVNDGAQLSQNSIGSKIANKFFPSTKQFIKEFKAKDVSDAPLKEAEQWMKEWTSHPATQQKVANSFADAINQPMQIEGLSKMNLTDRMAVKDAYSNNLKLGYDQISNYDPTGKLNYYPINKQIKDAIIPFKNNIHLDNSGVSYTHLSPPEGLLNSELMNKAEFATNLNHNRMGNWVSRAISDENKLSTGIHELTHDYGKDFPLEYLGQKEMINNNIGATVTGFKENIQSKLDAAAKAQDKKEIKRLTDLSADLDYMSNPTEVHARIMELRKHQGIKPNDVISNRQADKILSSISAGNTPVATRFAQILGNNKSTANIFNNAWMTIPALGAGALLNSTDNNKKTQ